MSMQVAQKMRQLAADGRFGKADFATAAVDTLDGRGLTKSERALISKEFKRLQADPDVYVNQKAEDAFSAFMKRTAHYSESKRVYAPTLDKEELQSMLQVRASQLDGGSRSSRASGGEYSGASTRPTYSSGEYGGGHVAPSTPSHRPSYSSGEYGGGGPVATSGGEY